MKTLSYQNVTLTNGFFRDYVKLMLCRVVPAALGDRIGDLAAISTAIIGWRNQQ